MELKDIIILAAVSAALAFNIYRRYKKKNQAKDNKPDQSGSSFSSASEDDNYEPYSNK